MTAPFLRGAAACVAILLLQSAGSSAPEIGPQVARPNVPLQPLAQQARLLDTTRTDLGQPLAAADRRVIDDAMAVGDEEDGVQQLQHLLDKYALAVVRINSDSRVTGKRRTGVNLARGPFAYSACSNSDHGANRDAGVHAPDRAKTFHLVDDIDD